MRISDWSSDVCSSDLTDYHRAKWGPLARGALRAGEWLALSFADRVIAVSPSLAAQLRQSFPQRAHSIASIPNGTSDLPGDADPALIFERLGSEIGRASCRERVCQSVKIPVVAGQLKKKKQHTQ